MYLTLTNHIGGVQSVTDVESLVSFIDIIHCLKLKLISSLGPFDLRQSVICYTFKLKESSRLSVCEGTPVRNAHCAEFHPV